MLDDTLNVYENSTTGYTVVFRKKSIYHMNFYVDLIGGGGSNPVGGQQVKGTYSLAEIDGTMIIENGFSIMLGPNIVGGTLFSINTNDLAVPKKYKLVVNVSEGSELFKKFYSSSLRVYLKRPPSHPVVF